MKPFLKWAGGKYKSIDKIKSILPQSDNLIEPFCGSCAVALNTNYKNYILADNNGDLINLYKTLVEEQDEFIEYVKTFFTEQNRSKENYYKLRQLFNTTKDTREKSALFIYLNRHGFNGLCRYNSKGGYNVPIGDYKTIYFPEKEMQFFAKKLKNAKFINCSFEKSMNLAKNSDTVYCDPPYVPLSATASFTAYTKIVFDLSAQKYLVNFAEKLHKVGVNVFISNHYNKITQSLYAKSKIINFPVRRMISAKAKNRIHVMELIACYCPNSKLRSSNATHL